MIKNVNVQKNIRMINDFYNSDYYDSLVAAGEKYLIKDIIESIYIDPDSYDMDVCERLSQKLNSNYKCIRGKYILYKDEKINLSADAVCGWKQLYNLRNGDAIWLDDYEKIRTCIAAYLVWPQHTIPTINTLRYSVYNDRVDYTLFDISNFFDCKKNAKKENQEQFVNNVKAVCKLHKAYLNPNGKTYEWLMTFNEFGDFVKEMQLTRFVNQENKVLNVENNSVILKAEEGLCYSFNETYLENLKKIINNDIK